MFKSCLVELGYDSTHQYGLQSLRVGGETAVVNSNVISIRLTVIYGLWKTHTAKHTYIHEDISRRLEVTSDLGV